MRAPDVAILVAADFFEKAGRNSETWFFEW